MMIKHEPRDERIIELEAEIRDLKEMLADYGRFVLKTPTNTVMLLGATLSGGDVLALAKKLEKPGTHCSVYGEPMKGGPRPAR